MKTKFKLEAHGLGLIQIADVGPSGKRTKIVKFWLPKGKGDEFRKFLKSLKRGDVLNLSKSKESASEFNRTYMNYGKENKKM